ncbi:unnamed protein product [Cochlearia groenlandica]
MIPTRLRGFVAFVLSTSRRRRSSSRSFARRRRLVWLEDKFALKLPAMFVEDLRGKDWLAKRQQPSYSTSDFELPSDLGIDSAPQVFEYEEEEDDGSEEDEDEVGVPNEDQTGQSGENDEHTKEGEKIEGA